MNPTGATAPDRMYEFAVGMLCAFVPIGVVVLYALFYPSIQAYRRGYNPFVWALVGFLALNPVFLLVLLGMVPNRARMKLRDEFADELDEKLKEAGIAPTVPAGVPVRDTSIGDEETRMPGRDVLRSIGDEMTEMPRDRSIGDDATRM